MSTDLENAWDKGFKTGSRSRDAEIERLKARIDRLEWCGCGDRIGKPKCVNCAMIDNLDLDSADIVERLRAGIREMERQALASHKPDILCVCCEWVHRKCDELLKGVGDGE